MNVHKTNTPTDGVVKYISPNQWTLRLGWVDQGQPLCCLTGPAGQLYRDNGDRWCKGQPAGYLAVQSHPTKPERRQFICGNCAARAAYTYGHAFPPSKWIETNPPAAPR